jgi:hypothetical protein
VYILKFCEGKRGGGSGQGCIVLIILACRRARSACGANSIGMLEAKSGDPAHACLFVIGFRVTGGKIGTEQAARGWAAGHRQDEVR